MRLMKRRHLLKNVIQVFELQDFDEGPCPGELQDHVHCLHTGQIGITLVDSHPIRHAVRTDRPFEESPGSSRITVLGQHEPKVREAKSRV